MKKLFLIFLIFPALACFSGSMARVGGTLISLPTATGTESAVRYLDVPTVTATRAAGCVVTVKSLNVREEPEADVIGWLHHGDVVTILEGERRGAWIRIRAGSVTGWIHSNYCGGK